MISLLSMQIFMEIAQIQSNKQIVSSLKRRSCDDVDDLLQGDNANRLNSRWNNDELQMAAKGMRKYGKDFQAVAEMLGTKTESQVRTFYLNSRRKYNLDALVEEYERETKEQNLDISGDAIENIGGANNEGESNVGGVVIAN